MQGLRARFVRDLVDSFERESGADAVIGAVMRLEPRLSRAGVRATLRGAAHADAIDVADAEELLFGLDSALSDGSGQLLERMAAEQLGRMLSQDGFSIPGDLMGTVARMQAPLEHLFVGLPVGFDLSKKRDGFVLFIGVRGRPRTTRLLSHLTVALVRACQRFAREGTSEEVRISVESLGERARVEARLGALAPAAPLPISEARAPKRRGSQPHLATTKPTLEALDRILQRASVAPPTAGPDEIVAVRSRRPATLAEEPRAYNPARTDTLPSTPRSGIRSTRDDEPSSSSG